MIRTLFLFQSNTYFQAALHQAKSWKLSSDTFEKDFKSERVRAEVAEALLKEKEEELARAHAELVKLRSDKEDLIDEYMESKPFKDLMEFHDEGLFPVQFTQGWNQALDAVSQKHPGMIDTAEFISPHPPPGEEDDSDDFMGSPMNEDRIIDPEDTHSLSLTEGNKSPSPVVEKEVETEKEAGELSPPKE